MLIYMTIKGCYSQGRIQDFSYVSQKIFFAHSGGGILTTGGGGGEI